MEKVNNTGLRESLAQLPPEDLRAMLQAELEHPEPDPDSVRMILRVLEEQTPEEQPEQLSQRDAAWETYQKRVEGLRRKPAANRAWMLRAASVVLVLGLLFAVVPQQAEAETFWEMLQRLSNTVIGYLDRDDKLIQEAYAFETENPGLQQLHDAVVELGVTEPVVPMWLPEMYNQVEIVKKNTPMKMGIHASFRNGDNEIVYMLDVYEGEPAHQFYRDNTYYDSYERNGATYTITRNSNWWSVIWTKDNIECHITLDCQEETLRRILKSIYVMEE